MIKQLDILANGPVTKTVLFALGVQLVNLQRVNASPSCLIDTTSPTSSAVSHSVAILLHLGLCNFIITSLRCKALANNVQAILRRC